MTVPRQSARAATSALRLLLRRYARHLVQHWRLAVPALLLPGLGDLLIFYAPPLLIARLLGTFARQQSLSGAELSAYLAGFAGLWFAGEIVWRIAQRLIARTEIRVIEALHLEAITELLQQEVTFFHDRRTGSLTTRATAYANRFGDVFDVICFSLCANLLPLPFIAALLWSYSPALVVTLIVMMTLTVIVLLPVVRGRRTLVDDRQAAASRLAGGISDLVTNAEIIRAFGREQQEVEAHAADIRAFGSRALAAWDYQTMRIELITAPLYVITNTLGLVLAYYTQRNGGVTLEAVFVTFSYYTVATRIIWEFHRIYRNLESALTDAAQFAELVLSPRTVLEPTQPEPFTPANYDLEIQNLSFRYDGSPSWAVQDLSFQIRSGSKVGFVGRSGAGKTTLTRLILLLLRPQQGVISIGGIRIDRVAQHALRGAIAYVPQDPSLFHRSVIDNIRIGRPGASDAEVRHAARLAHADEFIERMPSGYDTIVGERGIQLSGGQRQRLAIARALLKDAPILILDEATSALDSESEALIQDALATLMSNRTALVIAHRLSTVSRMDELIVLDRGTVAEQGTHESLLAQGGIYASMWTQQVGGFLGRSDRDTEWWAL